MTRFLSAGPGGRATRARRIIRRGLPLLMLALVGSGCATKRDIRTLRTDLDRLADRQDSIFRLLQLQNREILDSLTVTTEQMLNVRGELSNMMNRLQRQMEEVSTLTGQVQVRLNQLDQSLAQAIRNVDSAGIAGPSPGQGEAPSEPGGEPGTFNEASQLYEMGVEQIERGNAGTARNAFRMVMDSFPTSTVAPDAQRQIGETFVMERRYDDALRAFERVVEHYPDSDAAPMALYRAGVIAEERGNIERARQYFGRVISGYPSSDARRLAEEALERLNG